MIESLLATDQPIVCCRSQLGRVESIHRFAPHSHESTDTDKTGMSGATQNSEALAPTRLRSPQLPTDWEGSFPYWSIHLF